MKLIKSLLLSVSILASSIASSAGIIWLNIPSHWDESTGEFIHSMSFATFDRDACADAIVSYAKMDYIYYIGCDVVPLRDAVNVSDKVKKGYMR